ncbi:ABC transporter permease subunit [Halopenitus persicus]|uniref:ABC-type Fe3+ transport system, permease component n=1 Tax=Halopenitus persicus TaxID=1048396 RepID=A0A1H3P4L5_9EURY|nr:ABC transporter permease subunit [Halopenitus persicus]SDY95923.1 ABC-type Fe3+ transport system, permease component [Halopenitus persicus]
MSTESIFSQTKDAGNTLYGRFLSFIQKYKETEYAPYILAGPYLGYLIFIFAIPVGYLLLISFYTNVSFGTMEPAFTFNNYVEFFSNSTYVDVLVNTVEISIISTIFTVAVSFPVAYFIVFSGSRYSVYLILLVIAPMLVGNVVRAFGWWTVMGDSGLINQFLGIFGVQQTFLQTKPGLIIAISSVLMPFVILILMSVLFTLDSDVISAANNLGGNHLQTFFYVTFPLALPGIFASSILCFVLTMGTFATAVFIGMPEIPMIGPYIYITANQSNWPLAAAMSFVLLIISLSLVLLYGYLVNSDPGGSTSSVETNRGRGKKFYLSGVLNKLDFGHTIAGVSLPKTIMKGILGISLLYLLIPVIFAIQISFNPSTVYAFPPEYLTLKWYEYVLSRPAWISSFITSFQYSILASVLAIGLSAPTAYALDRFSFRGKQVLRAGTFLPLMVPQIILGLALLLFLNELRLIGSILGLSIGLGIVATPYAVQTMLATMHNFDNTVEEAAKNLGADEIQTFVRITLPGILPGILTAAILTFIVTYSNLTIAIFLQGPENTPIPTRIYAQMQYGASPSIAAVATINIIIVIVAVVLVERFFGAADALGFTGN